MVDARVAADAQLRQPRPVSLAGAVVVVALWLTLAVGAVLLTRALLASPGSPS